MRDATNPIRTHPMPLDVGPDETPLTGRTR
jgi:hypothetical protein